MNDPDGAPGRPHMDLSQMLRRLAQRSSVVRAGRRVSAEPVAVIRQGHLIGTVVRADFERARRAGFIEETGNGWRLSATGRDAVRRLAAGAAERPAANETTGRPGFNADESPLAWLRRRRGKDGAALISEAQFQAGERLRTDFTLAHLAPSVTSNWNAALGAAAGGRRGAPGAGVELTDAAMAARERVNRALAAVGPEFSGILLDVCCFLRGLEDCERSVGWPQRSGKVVLQLGLTSLARHYGMPEAGHDRTGRGTPPPRHWGAADYRPTIGVITPADPSDQVLPE